MYLSDIVPAGKAREWRLLVESDCEGESDLADSLSQLKGGELSGWLKLFELAAEVGPTALPASNRHEVDKDRKIWEFIKGNYRVLYFYDEGKLIVCSHIFRKKSQKTPESEKKKVCRLRDRYFEAKEEDKLIFVE
ncbi:type II toxin-antitoxin system RelE/ParE family toxin [Simiduia aestuariiviva]|uniref:mRNA-degrading endonuclease RelE of RelBE toxin-antitoxin system n=1 Tax=Simiduia aestuariiviva TaxID=1510459 RepID=A0A839UUP1_9GAMM|nr:type II toxin-antitoxin system RelE/ParE family toxin [Simiduia aestuariiviva]MBB3170149.1 mRNA-degrading endonuclease RelE of RelBE toxin-antitoxin system [Simiduia aestuariiviva]